MDPAPPNRRFRQALAAAAVASAFGFVVLVATAVLFDADFGLMMREPQSALGGPFYAGFFSNLGAVFWAVGAIACLFAATLVDGEERRMLLIVGGLTAMLGLDDLFLLHDEVYVRAKINDKLVEAAYGVAALWVTWRYGRRLGVLGLASLIAAQAFWGVSVVVDFIGGRVWYRIVVEDGAKFVGICVWSAIWTVVAHHVVQRRLATTA